MACVIHVGDMREGYLELIEDVRQQGDRVAPRDQATREIRNAVMVFDPTRPFAWGINRKISSKILAAETMQILAGVSDLVQLAAASKGRFILYSDDGIKLHGAYGPRLYRGLTRVVDKLDEDPDSRQGHAVIWNRHELQQPTRDLPCTSSLTFDIRDDRLNMTVFMRSSDVLMGLTYDVPTFANIQAAIAKALGIPMGEYVHHSASLHIYERDFELHDQMELQGSESLATMPKLLAEYVELTGDTAAMRWREMQFRAFAAVSGESSDWYGRTLSEVDAGEALCQRCRYIVPKSRIELDDHDCVEV